MSRSPVRLTLRLLAPLALLLLAGVVVPTGPRTDHSLAAHRPVSASASPRASGTGGGRPGPATSTLPTHPADPLDRYLSRLPHFPPAPPPRPVTVPAGPDAGWYSRIPTDQPVAFITIDDGWVKHPDAERLIRAAGVPVTLFLTVQAVHGDPEYFRRLQAAGAVIDAHTLTHPSLKGKPYAVQRHEICGSADQLAGWYGRRPVLFRPPFGAKDETTLRASRDCGMPAAFFWTETVDKGVVRYQVGSTVRPGDIILMHFRPAFPDDFLAALTAIHRAGLTPALLDDYVTGPR